MKASSRKLLVLILVLVVSTILGGCGGGSQNRELKLGNVGWDENQAVSYFTQVLLEDELAHENVEVQTTDFSLVFEDVSNGGLNAFQDVWLPNDQQLLDEQGDSIELLGNWFQGQIEFGIAVPSYVNVTSLEELNGSGIDIIYGIEPDVVIMERISDSVIPTYNLKQELMESSTQDMLAEVDNHYKNGEAFAFIGWSPHWMNQYYDFRLLEDPQDALGELNDPARISTVVNSDLPDDDPAAYAFLGALTLTEEQVNDLEDTINKVGDPLEGARNWAQNNPDVVEPWIEAAQNAQED
jgi:glycine betaine/proline transport system substrate-binding protein